jgi:hypothetical protein
VFKLRGAHLGIGIDGGGLWGWWVQYEVEIERSQRDDDELSCISFMATAKLTQLMNDLVAAMRLARRLRKHFNSTNNVGDKRAAKTSELRTPVPFSPLIIYHPPWLNQILLNRAATKRIFSLLSQLLRGGKLETYTRLQQRTTSLKARYAADSLELPHDAIARPT